MADMLQQRSPSPCSNIKMQTVNHEPCHNNLSHFDDENDADDDDIDDDFDPNDGEYIYDEIF